MNFKPLNFLKNNSPKHLCRATETPFHGKVYLTPAYTFYLRQLNWLPIRQRRTLYLLFSILFEPSAPSYLKCRFSFVTPRPGCELRSSRSLKLLVFPHHSGFLSSSFTVQAIRLWNSLPLTGSKQVNF